MSRYERGRPPPIRKKRSKWPWIIVVVLLLASFGLAAVGLARAAPAVRDLAKNGGEGLAKRLPEPLLFPGTHTVNIDEPGSWKLFHESESLIDGRPVDSPPGADLEVSLRSRTTGEELVLKPTRITETYNLPHRNATAIGQFEVKQTGEYELTAKRKDAPEAEFVLAVGKDVLMKAFGGAVRIVAIFALAGLCFLASVVLGIVLLVRR